MFIKHIVRFLFVVFWALVIYAFLLVPYLDAFLLQDQKYLCIYTWADRVDESVLKKFENKTGIKVYVNYYESNEELLTKLENMPYVDCDIILPSGYIIDKMIQSSLLKKLDMSRCHFFKTIYQDFIGMDFDPDNDYSLPLYWDVLGIGYNNKHVSKSEELSLDLIFNRSDIVGNQIGMIDDARQSIVLAALYLGYPLNSLTVEELKLMRPLLNQQKKWVGAYSDSQQGYFLASETFSLVVSEREHICRQMLNHDFISFALPIQGSLLTVDNVVISSSTKKEDMVYELINYLFSPEVLQQHCEKFCVLPTLQVVFENLDQKYIGIEGLYPGGEKFKKLKKFKNVLTHKQINDFWVRLKAS